MIRVADPDNLGIALRDIRRLLGMTRRDLARAIVAATGRHEAGVYRQLQEWDSGMHSPTVRSLAPCLAALGYDLALIPRDAEPVAEPGRCTKCGGTLTACVDCGKPAQCGEPWCAQHSPDGDWGTVLIPREEA